MCAVALLQNAVDHHARSRMASGTSFYLPNILDGILHLEFVHPSIVVGLLLTCLIVVKLCCWHVPPGHSSVDVCSSLAHDKVPEFDKNFQTI